MRRTSVAGKKRKEKEGGYAVSARLPVYRVGDEQPPEIRWPSEHGYGDFCSLRIAYRVYSSRWPTLSRQAQIPTPANVHSLNALQVSYQSETVLSVDCTSKPYVKGTLATFVKMT